MTEKLNLWEAKRKESKGDILNNKKEGDKKEQEKKKREEEKEKKFQEKIDKIRSTVSYHTVSLLLKGSPISVLCGGLTCWRP